MAFKSSKIGRFVFLNDQGQFEIDESTAKQFECMRGGIVFVCVAGNYRTGKSFLLNCLHGSTGQQKQQQQQQQQISPKLVRRQSGFAVGDSTNACTRGIWARWRENEKEKCRDGSMCHVVYLDTEGLADVDQNHTHDTQIFALSVLLSSCFVYNTMGTINESALDSLAMVTHLASKIYRTRTTPPATTTTTPSMPTTAPTSSNSMFEFPHFMWAVRDFSLLLKDDSGNPIDSDQYLENALREKAGDNPNATAKNQIRTVFKEMFPNRACQTLVRPCVEEVDLQSLFSLNSPNIRPQFLEGINRIKSWLADRSRPKSVGKTVLSGRLFVELARQYVSAINDGAIPNIATALDNAISAEASVAYDAALKKYHESRVEFIKNVLGVDCHPPTDASRISFPIDAELLVRAHTHATSASLAEWTSLMENSIHVALFDKLKDELERLLAEAETTNRNESLIQCRKCADSALAMADEQINTASSATSTQFLTQLLKLTTVTVLKYLAEAKGPQVLGVLQDALMPHLSQALAARGKIVEQGFNCQHDELRHQFQIASAALQTKAIELSIVSRERDTSQNLLNSVTSEKTELQGRLNSVESKLRSQESELESSRSALAQREMMRNHLEQKMSETHQNISFLEQQLTQTLKDLEQSKEVSQKQFQQQQSMILGLTTEKSTLETQISEKDSELSKLNSRIEGFAKKQQANKNETRSLKVHVANLEANLEASRNKFEESIKSAETNQSQMKMIELQGQLDTANERVRELTENLQTASATKRLHGDESATHTGEADSGASDDQQQPSARRTSKRQKVSRRDSDTSILESVNLSPVTQERLKRPSCAGLVQPPPPDLSESELNSFTIPRLRKLLTQFNVDIPQTKIQKRDLISLYITEVVAKHGQ